MPAGGLIQQRLQGLRSRSDWALLDCRIEHLEDFQASQGFLAADELLHRLATLLSDVVQSSGGEDDFLGHAGSGNFIILSTPALAAGMADQIKERFAALVKESPLPGKPDAAGEGANGLKISIGLIEDSDGPFADLAALTEAALSARRKDSTEND